LKCSAVGGRKKKKTKHKRSGIFICFSTELKVDLEVFLAKTEVAFPVVGRSSQITWPHPLLLAFGLPGEVLQRNWRRKGGQQQKGEHTGQV